jgi:hypothetical protein
MVRNSDQLPCKGENVTTATVSTSGRLVSKRGAARRVWRFLYAATPPAWDGHFALDGCLLQSHHSPFFRLRSAICCSPPSRTAERAFMQRTMLVRGLILLPRRRCAPAACSDSL